MSSEKKPQPVGYARERVTSDGDTWLEFKADPTGDMHESEFFSLYSEATIEALLAERDEANEELGKVIMACPPGSRGMPIHPHVSALRYRLETAEARVAQLEAALEPNEATKAAYNNRFFMGIEVRLGRERENRSIQIPWDAIVRIMDAIRARALLSDGGETPKLPADVVRLVIAAREVAYGDIETLARATDDDFKPLMDELDKALEAFAARVEWDDESSLDDKALQQSGGPDAK